MPSSDLRPLAGKAALVTGATSGTGRAIALALAEAGAAVSFCGRRLARLEETAAAARAYDVPIHYQALDVADPDAVQAWVNNAHGAFGRIDILVNNAGTNIPNRYWKDSDRQGWNEIIATNLSGVYHCTQAALPVMRAQQDGLIINISSVAGIQPSLVSGVAYSASKYGVVSLTQSLNLEEWRNGIRATAICPGEMATEILAKRPNPPSHDNYALFIQPEDLGETVVFLATLPSRIVIDQLVMHPTVREH
ncbi:MAG TPA: SDR family oxidoreductase [Chloroflexota bacterium]|nr:SDR family oxidoreductase [Chloroflexota bacterium]